MATITIRNLDESVKRKLQIRAAMNGRSMEAEAREVLSELILPSLKEVEAAKEEDFGTAIRKRFAAFGGVELEIPSREDVSQQDKRTLKENAGNPLREGLGTAIHRLFAPLGGVELEIPPRRKSHRQIPTFE